VTCEINLVPDAMIAEPALPNWKAHVHFQSQPSCGSTLNVLHHAFERFVSGRRKQHMKMIWHQNKTV